jgi:hypothetical protein
VVGAALRRAAPAKLIHSSRRGAVPESRAHHENAVAVLI